MSAVALGLAGAGLGILARASRQHFLSGMLLLGAGANAPIVFAGAPAPFGALLVAALGALAVWSALPPADRDATALAAGASGLFCAAVAPNLAALVPDLAPAFGWDGGAGRVVAALGAVIVGTGIAGAGGGALAFLACGLGLGLLDHGTLARWAIPLAACAVAILARISPRGAVAGLCAATLLTLPEA